MYTKHPHLCLIIRTQIESNGLGAILKHYYYNYYNKQDGKTVVIDAISRTLQLALHGCPM